MLAVRLAFFFVASPTFIGLCLALLEGCSTFSQYYRDNIYYTFIHYGKTPLFIFFGFTINVFCIE